MKGRNIFKNAISLLKSCVLVLLWAYVSSTLDLLAILLLFLKRAFIQETVDLEHSKRTDSHICVVSCVQRFQSAGDLRLRMVILTTSTMASKAVMAPPTA